MSTTRVVPVLGGLVLTTVLTLAGCGSGESGDGGGDGGGDGTITVVASTDVWGSIAERVGGDAVSVESLITDASGDPHAHPDRPSDAAALADADVVVYNGGGYDEFFSKLVDSTGVDVPSVNAFELSAHADEAGGEGHEDGGNGAGADGGADGDADGANGGEGGGAGGNASGDSSTGGSGGAGNASGDAGDSGDARDSSGGSSGGEGGQEDGGDSGAGGGEGTGGHEDGAGGHKDGHEGGAGEDAGGHEGGEDAGGHGHEHGAVNEHVWYDLPTVGVVADTLAEEFATLAPDERATFTENAAALNQELDTLLTTAAGIGEANPGAKVLATEPVATYLIDAAGLTDVTPPEFSEAIEEETDPPLAVVAETTALLTDHTVSALINNAQTETPVTNSLKDAADQAGIPVVDVTETLPDGVTDYVEWMTSEVDALATALGAS